MPAGEYYYFRARYNTVNLDIAKTSSHWAKGKLLWTISGDYGKTPYAAGWMPEEKAIELANRMIERYLKIKRDEDSIGVVKKQKGRIMRGRKRR